MLKNVVIFLQVLLSFLGLSTQATVILDGSLGAHGQLAGPDYHIEAALGQHRGHNLFHSFSQFSLNPNETATFSGPADIQHIISRVTGGAPSQINGVLRTTLPHADMWLLNPNGVIFGPQARLELKGAFYVSTADYLRLADNGRFDARQLQNSVLTVAPPRAFGFLAPPAALEVRAQSLLATPARKTFSLVGGDITMRQAQLIAPQGQINLISVADVGEVDVSHYATEAFAQLGRIRLMDNTLIQVDGPGAGQITLRGQQLKLYRSQLQARTLADQTGQGITLLLTEKTDISGQGSDVSSITLGSGNAGQIHITTPQLTLSMGQIDATSQGPGRAGNITLNTAQMRLNRASEISSDSVAQGSGGNINIQATERLQVIDERVAPTAQEAFFTSGITTTALAQGEGGHITIDTGQLQIVGGSITSNTHAQGNAGRIVINAKQAEFTQGGFISSTALSQATGQGGNIKITVQDRLMIQGLRQGFIKTNTDIFEDLQSGIAALTFGQASAGNITVSAQQLVLDNQGAIGVGTLGEGAAGTVDIQVGTLQLTAGGLITGSSGGIVGKHLFLGTGHGGTVHIVADRINIAQGDNSLTGIVSNTLASGKGGHVVIKANTLNLSDKGIISANSQGRGDAGNIDIQLNDYFRGQQGSAITTQAPAAQGGNIHLQAQHLLYLVDSDIIATVGGQGEGGDIELQAGELIVFNQGRVVAKAFKGQGGNIQIRVNNYLASTHSNLDASSQFGVNGSVVIEAPEININNALVSLSATFLETSHLLQDQCQSHVQSRSRLLVIPLPGSRAVPSDWQNSPVLFDNGQQLPVTLHIQSHPKANNKLMLKLKCHQATG